MGSKKATTVKVSDVAFAEGLIRDKGGIEIKARFLVNAENAGNDEVVCGRTLFEGRPC
jgi:hypothetical protein